MPLEDSIYFRHLSFLEGVSPDRPGGDRQLKADKYACKGCEEWEHRCQEKTSSAAGLGFEMLEADWSGGGPCVPRYGMCTVTGRSRVREVFKSGLS